MALLRRLQARRVCPLVQVRRDIRLACFLQESITLRTRWERSGLLANLIGPRGESVFKCYVLLEAASELHDITSCLRVLTVGLIRTLILLRRRGPICSLVNRSNRTQVTLNWDTEGRMRPRAVLS